MKCVICNSQNINDKTIDEEIKLDNDVVIVSINTLVCESCGERYYNKQTMKILEDIEESCGAWGYNVDSEIFVNELSKSNRLDWAPYD